MCLGNQSLVHSPLPSALATSQSVAVNVLSCLSDEQRAWFISQVELDTQFLKDLAVMDYSLLVAYQPLHLDEQTMNRTLANIIARTRR